MKIKSKLLALTEYYNRTRGVGHTKALKLLGKDVIILCATRVDANQFYGGLTLDDDLRNKVAPMVLDNHLVMEIAEEAMAKITFLEQKVQAQKQILTKMASVMKEYESYLKIYYRDELLELHISSGYSKPPLSW